MTQLILILPQDRKKYDFSRETPWSKKLHLIELYQIPEADHFYRLHTLYLLKTTLATYTKDHLMFRIVLYEDKTRSSAHVLQQLHLETTEQTGLPTQADQHGWGAQRSSTVPHQTWGSVR